MTRAQVVALLLALSGAHGAQAQADAGAADAGAGAGEEMQYGAVATATRLARPLRNVSSAVTVIPRQELALSPVLSSDGKLRAVPSLATFRRSNSLTADPSAQGVNLRGVGPSGVSRSLVLLDGLPLNDPFSGSIYFRSLPRLGLERVEVVPGGGSALYGSSALAGVVQLVSREDARDALDADLSYGSFSTALLSARAAGASERVSSALEGEWLRSSGYVPVAKSERGAIDRDAHSQHVSLNGRLALRANRRLRVVASGGLFGEELDHSTRYTSAGVRLATTTLRARYDARKRGLLDLMWFGRLARFTQERTRVGSDRASEQRAARQRVPAGDIGAALTWSHRLAAGAHGLPTQVDDTLGHHPLAGADARYAIGTSHEQLFPVEPSSEALRKRDAGGRQLLVGAFVADVWRLRSYLQIEGALRVDLIRDERGFSVLARYSGSETRTDFATRQRVAINPRLGVLVEPHRTLRVRASAYRSFRAASLNELYRSFQVGTVLTAANPALRPETLLGAELGLEQRPSQPITLRAVGFYNRLDDPIVNATLSQPLADGSARQRTNLGRARIAGLELSGELRLFTRLSILLSYTFVDARVIEQGAVAGLRGKRLAQDPRQRLSALVSFDEPRWFSAALQLRYLGAQYEDDLNTLIMRPYATVDASLARRLFWQLELYLSVENLLDQRYLVGRAGVDTIGQPLFVRAGLRVRDAYVGRP